MPDFIRSGGDAFGKALLDYHTSGQETMSQVTRIEDGNEEEMPSSDYFAEFSDWTKMDRALTHWIEGRVLDIGTGAGRLALYCQERGHDVVAIDLSDCALQVTRERGVKDVRRHDILGGPLDEKFDTICLFGMNLGIAGFHNNRLNFLSVLKSMLNPGGRIIGTQVNWDRTTRQAHIDFQRQLRDAGGYPVEMTLRITYDGIDEGFSWVLTNSEELTDLADELKLETEMIMDSSAGVYGYVLRMPDLARE